MSRSTKSFVRLVALTLLTFATLAWARPSRAAGLEAYHLYVIWLTGEGEGDKDNLDAFIACLHGHSNYFDYWKGDVLVVEEGSYVVTRPSSALGDAGNIGPFIQSLIASKAIPAPPSWGTPIYQVMVDPSQTSCALGGGTGGRNAPGAIGGKPAGFILNTTNPSAFWPARTPLAGETTLTEHEVAEVIDQLRGGSGCAGDFCCEGWCGNAASCGNLTGLSCPGAPSTTFTGSSACGSVSGWLVQTLSHQGASTCTGPVTCDFELGAQCSGDKDTLHTDCTADSDCCAGTICASWTYTGQNPTRSCCKAVGASCQLGTDCCGGMNCTGGACVCVPAGQFCANDGDCCSGLVCSSAACAAPAPEPQPEAGTTDSGTSAVDASAGRDGGAPPPADDAGATFPDASTDDGGPDAGSASGSSGGCSLAGASVATGPGGWLAVVLLGGLRRRRRLVR